MAMCQYRSLDDVCTVYKREPLLQPFMYAIIYLMRHCWIIDYEHFSDMRLVDFHPPGPLCIGFLSDSDSRLAVLHFVGEKGAKDYPLIMLRDKNSL